MKRYAGRAPIYVRIRVELCAARRKRGGQVHTYLSRSFVSPLEYGQTLEQLLEHFDAEEMPKRERTKLAKQVREAMRRSKADLPEDIDLKQFLAKRKQLAKAANQRFKQRDLATVFKRIPQRDFERYSASIQRYLIRYLAYKHETSRIELRHMGMQWKTYVPGKAQSLFRGKTRAKKKR